MKFKLSKSNWPRLAFQWGVILVVAILAILPVFISFTPDFEALCPFGGIQALGSYFINNSLTCSMTSAQIVMGIAMMIGVFLFSKLFCSYICPVGTFTEWFGKLGDKLKVRIQITGILDKALRSIKYILFFITLYYTFDSSELFCKKFDPFYAVTTGFSMDVVVLYASIAIFIVIIGSVFINMFWCKYICPFGALSNIFKFTGFFVLLMVIYIALLKFGLEITYVWPLAIASIGGFIIEVSGFKTRLFPIAKITRNESSCTNCNLCTLKCPQGIDVANMDEVRDADCNLCSDCVVACPAKDTLQINKSSKLKWIAPIATAVLIAAGMYIGTFFEVPTIDQQWFAPSEMAKAQVYSRSGLKSIKCYGSCTAFANQMHKVKGVMGVTAYVGTKTVKIFYDPQVVTETQLEEAIFTPMKAPLRTLEKGIDEVQKVTIKIDKFFDTYDFNYLSVLLQQKTKAIGIETVYGCPVIANIFFPGNMEINEQELTEILESESLTYISKEKEYTVELVYEVIGDYSYTLLTKAEYAQIMFRPYHAAYARKKKYSEDVIQKLAIPMGKNKAQAKNLKYLGAHFNNILEVVELSNSLDNMGQQVLEISFVDSLTTREQVYNQLNMDTLRFMYSSGKKGTIKNMFDFKAIKPIEQKKD